MAWQRWAAGALVALGVALLAYMVVHEDEPGLLPLVLLGAGVGWYVVAGRRRRR